MKTELETEEKNDRLMQSHKNATGKDITFQKGGEIQNAVK